uniref:Uncharacterized protein n=1 Tax=Steinernema glaseri TaxID=37863 RepID=A0A1I7YCL0_9BILA
MVPSGKASVQNHARKWRISLAKTGSTLRLQSPLPPFGTCNYVQSSVSLRPGANVACAKNGTSGTSGPRKRASQPKRAFPIHEAPKCVLLIAAVVRGEICHLVLSGTRYE